MRFPGAWPAFHQAPDFSLIVSWLTVGGTGPGSQPAGSGHLQLNLFLLRGNCRGGRLHPRMYAFRFAAVFQDLCAYHGA